MDTLSIQPDELHPQRREPKVDPNNKEFQEQMKNESS